MGQGRHTSIVFQAVTLLTIVLGTGYAVLRLNLFNLFPALSPEAMASVLDALLAIWLGTLAFWLIMLVMRLRSVRPRRRSGKKPGSTSILQHRESTMAGQWRQPDVNSVWASTNRDTRERIRSTERHPALPDTQAATARTSILPNRLQPDVPVIPVATLPAPTDWSMTLLHELEWHRFEEVCAATLRAFGLDARALASGPDSDTSLHIWRSDAPGLQAIGRTRAGTTTVDVERMRALYATLTRDQVSQAYFLTAGNFSDEAIAAGRGAGMILIDGETLLKRIRSLPAEQQDALLQLAVQGDFRSPTCPTCTRKMVLRSGDFKSFWRCTGYPECRCRLTLAGDSMLLS